MIGSLKEEKTKMNICRCCHNDLGKQPILKYTNMPKSAQYFPCYNDIKQEKGVDLCIYQCPYCNLIQIPGDPVPYFRSVIRATGVSKEMSKFRQKFFNDFVNSYGLKDKKIIEVGAGCGEYMELMRTAGVRVYGIEYLQESVNKGREKHLHIIQGFIEDAHYHIPGGPYDAFYIMNFLEHIPTPDEFLKGILNNIKEDAVGIIEVPNVNMILEKLLFSEFISDHLLYFTKETLTALLELNGFEVLECKAIWYDYIISAIVRKKKLIKIDGFISQVDKVIKSVNRYIDIQRNNGKKVAVWGAGHQALAILSITGISDKIECVIDSAEFKQNKYTPATHIPTVSPEILNNGSIRAVLIMAAGFSDEIASIIKKGYSDIDIAILRNDGVEVIE